MTRKDPTCRACGSDSVIGVQVRGVYDGVCYWQCPNCGRVWNAFPKGDIRWSAVEKRLALMREMEE